MRTPTLIAAAVLVGCYGFETNEVVEPSGEVWTPEIVVRPLAIDFGPMLDGTSETAVVTIENRGTGAPGHWASKTSASKTPRPAGASRGPS